MKRADLGEREQRTGRGDAAFEAGEEAVDVVLGIVRRHRPRSIRASVSLGRPPALTRSGSLGFGSLSDELLVSREREPVFRYSRERESLRFVLKIKNKIVQLIIFYLYLGFVYFKK